jgi:hypothetical protein
MIFRIVWLKQATSEAHQLWTEANDVYRIEIRGAIEDLHNALQSDPQEEGESRYASRRIIFRWPLFAVYDIDEDRGIVWIVSVGRLRGSSDET